MRYVAKNRYSTQGVIGIKTHVVVHDSEGGELPAGYQQLVNAFYVPGTTPNPGGQNPFIGAAYHAVANPDGGYTLLDFQEGSTAVGPYSAPPLNGLAWHICIPGKANQTREQWLDVNSRPYIKGVAKFIVDQCEADDIPVAYRTPDELKAGLHGYTSHNNVSLAWRKSTHTDPGPNFPWDVLAADIVALQLGDLPDPDPNPNPNPNPSPSKQVCPMTTPNFTQQSGDDAVFYGEGLLEKRWVPAGFEALQLRTIAAMQAAGYTSEYAQSAVKLQTVGKADMATFGVVVGPMPHGTRDAYGAL